MAIKITIGNKCAFKVKGKEPLDDDGKEREFEFTLIAKRLKQDELDQAQRDIVQAAVKDNNHQAVTTKLLSLVEGWKGVKGEDDQELPYTEAGLTDLLNSRAGLALHTWRVYQEEASVKAKN